MMDLQSLYTAKTKIEKIYSLAKIMRDDFEELGEDFEVFKDKADELVDQYKFFLKTIQCRIEFEEFMKINKGK